MSAGAFVTAKYQLSADSGGGIGLIRIQPETQAALIGSVANDPPTAPSNLPVRVRARGGAREYGIKARRVIFQFAATPPPGYTGEDLSVVALTPSWAALAVDGAVGTYLGVAVKVVGRIPERVK